MHAIVICCLFFFFSSRRRHTRFDCDWSSDVCSSDLYRVVFTSDSKYIVEGMSAWLPGWKARDWKKRNGPILNLELWKEADAAVSPHEIGRASCRERV